MTRTFAKIALLSMLSVLWLGVLTAKGDDGSAPPSKQSIDERNDRIDPTGLQRAWSRALNDQKLQPKDKLVAAVKVIATARNRFDPNFDPKDQAVMNLEPPNNLDNKALSPEEIALYEDAHWKDTLKAMYNTREFQKRQLYRMLVKFTRSDMGSLIAKMTSPEIADVMNQITASPDVKREIQADVFAPNPPSR